MKAMKRLKMFLSMDTLGSVGAVLAAAAAPCCFPLLAIVGRPLGLSALEPFKGFMAVKPVLQSILTCPQCGFRKEETMPTDSCQFFYECTNCHTLLRPKPGDCCVFCSYGSLKCPPKQLEGGCCNKQK